MHELSIAQSIVESVRAEMAGRSDARVARIGLKVGDLSGVQPDALNFSFEIIVRGTELEHAALDIERVPLTVRCAACNTEFRVLDYRTCCPGCGGEAATPVAGNELQLTYLELE